MTICNCLVRNSRCSQLAWTVSRKYWFSLLFLSVVVAKLIHLYSHRKSLSWPQFLAWGPTFFLQDLICIALFWALTRQYERKWVRVAAVLTVCPCVLGLSCMAAANMSFYITTGAEIHWRQAHSFHRDFASVKTLLSGLAGMVVIEILMLVASWFTTSLLYELTNSVLQTLGSSATSLFCRCGKKRTVEKQEVYEPVAYDDFDDSDTSGFLNSPEQTSRDACVSLIKRCCVLVPISLIGLLQVIRPADPAYPFLSETLPLTPFVTPKTDNRNPLLEAPHALGEFNWLGNGTALATPPKFEWLPAAELPGFRDWYSDSHSNKTSVHYDPSHDPLHISNLGGDLIQPLRKALHAGNVSIKHVLLLKLESTRYDVFPVRNQSYIHERIRQSYSGHIPRQVENRLANLTPTAERLTGTPSGFHQGTVQPYGGIHATNSYTSGTFTLKSITGSVCGLSPLVVDFNHEYEHHIYQPCIPHILRALNTQLESLNKTDDFTSWPWKTLFMQSITDLYDNQNLLTPQLGFQEVINVDNLVKDFAANPAAHEEQLNFWGYPDDELRSYVRNAITKAEEQQERLFITHLTGGTHYPWDTPHHEYKDMVGSRWLPFNRKFNRYLNTIGLADKWLGDILDILEETGVANETLVVMTGDHGITLPEDGGVTPYDNPHVSNFHVPLVFAHPQLPSIEIDGPVTSIQILPTILDLLKESASLNDPSKHIVSDLLPLYEGQSMIRPLIAERNGTKNWQFGVMNTGGSWLAVRSATTSYRLVIPLIPDVEWRFSNVHTDPREANYLMSFDLSSLIGQTRARDGDEAAQWIQEAASAARWWLLDNWRRYEYTPQ
ncbi:hypothetical protein ARAM_003971 [Aspergillus rambellii]|uniref:Sulfatase N-terminal domain-containing protein n=1 Tax=Aspergillus rambellii TaxID=308745 RepID=A0A0F8XIQ4_9EURO|nr:hypothetical protein ARAM_003971 [Aspergillus rambellii]